MRSPTILLASVVVVASACEQAAAPAPSSALPVPQAALAAPRLVSPADGVIINNGAPLIVANVPKDGGSIEYQFEVATNPSFHPIYEARTVAEGASQTSSGFFEFVTGTTSYWRVRASEPATGRTSAFSTPQTFNTPISCADMRAPILTSPSADATVPTRPTFVIDDAGGGPRPGFHFEISSDPAFRSVIAAGNATLPFGRSFTPIADLPAGATLYWRARQTETRACTASSDYAVAQPFVTAR